MIPRGTFELCCVYIAQLMTHMAIYTLPFTLRYKLCYKPRGILQRVTKSQKGSYIKSMINLIPRQKIYLPVY